MNSLRSSLYLTALALVLVFGPFLATQMLPRTHALVAVARPHPSARGGIQIVTNSNINLARLHATQKLLPWSLRPMAFSFRRAVGRYYFHPIGKVCVRIFGIENYKYL